MECTHNYTERDITHVLRIACVARAAMMGVGIKCGGTFLTAIICRLDHACRLEKLALQ